VIATLRVCFQAAISANQYETQRRLKPMVGVCIVENMTNYETQAIAGRLI
jgi:hypothetical protein